MTPSDDAESVAAYRLRARAWLADTPAPDVPLDMDGRFQALRRWQRTLYDAGWMGIHWPREFGGQGRSPLHHLAFYEELARAGAPPPVGLIGLDVIGPSILEYGTDEQRRRLLPPLLSGEEIWCQGFSEPDAGSDLASLRTRAELVGDEFRVTGQKVWTSWGHEADWCAVLARTDPDAPKHRGISYLLVPMDSPGITCRPLVQLTGDAEFNEVFFDDVRVPADHLLGPLHGGWTITMHTLGSERGTYALRRRVEFEAALRTLLAALHERRDSLPARALEDLGASYVALRALSAQIERTLERLSEGTGPTAVDSMDKLLLNATEQRIHAAALDLLGPGRMAMGASAYGVPAAPWIHAYLWSRAASIYGGTNEIQRNIVAERQLGLPKGS